MIKLSVGSIICINEVLECFCWSCIHKLILDFFFFFGMSSLIAGKYQLAVTHFLTNVTHSYITKDKG